MDPAQLVIVSDLHCGSKIGLMPPQVELDDGDIVRPNPVQKMAWTYWLEFWKDIERRAETRKTVVALNGDLIDGNHHGTKQIWSNDPDEHIDCAVEVLKPVAAKYPVYVTRGTPAHVLASGAADERIAKELGAVRPNPRRKVRSSYHLSLEFAGVLFDIAHHGPSSGNRMWTYGNGLRGYARTIVLDALVRHARPPDAIIRSHVHHRTHETVRDYGHRCEAIITPAWQWKTEFVHRVVSHEDVADIGGVIISIDNGKISDVEIPTLPLKQTDVVKV